VTSVTGHDMPDIAGLRIRPAVRALILDPDDRVLLVRFEFPNTGRRWALPGGGVEPGESDEDALRRELAEELGLSDVVIGPHVWDRTHVIPFINGLWDGQQERYYLVRTAAFTPAPHLSWEQLHAEYVYELRWWRAGEISDGLPFVPASLSRHLGVLLAEGPPIRPIDVGV
jgi:8-oxo-dGTP pyrophosphatase MutT (NUDIX family)